MGMQRGLQQTSSGSVKDATYKVYQVSQNDTMITLLTQKDTCDVRTKETVHTGYVQILILCTLFTNDRTNRLKN